MSYHSPNRVTWYPQRVIGSVWLWTSISKHRTEITATSPPSTEGRRKILTKGHGKLGVTSESHQTNQGASRVSRPGDVLYADICKLSIPQVTFLEKTVSARAPGRQGCARLFGSVPATGIWDLLNSKPLLFKDCLYLSGFRKEEGEKLEN